MQCDKINKIKASIQKLREDLNAAYTDENTPYDEVVAISHELDILILEYHRLFSELHRKRLSKNNP